MRQNANTRGLQARLIPLITKGLSYEYMQPGSVDVLCPFRILLQTLAVIAAATSAAQLGAA